MTVARKWDPFSPHNAGTTPPPSGGATVTSVAPSSIQATVATTISVNGSNFTPSSVVKIDGAPFATIFVANGQVRATVTLPTPGTVQVGVDNSATLPLTVTVAPAPKVTSLSPNTAEVGGADVTVVVTGTGFTASSVIVWNGSDEPTTFVSATQVSTLVKPSTASGAFTIPVAVRDAGGTSNSVDFSFTYPKVTAPGEQGWTVRNQIGTAQMNFVTSPAGNPVGTGSLNLVTGNSSADEVALQHVATFADIAAITDIAYSTHTVSANNNAASIVLVLDCTAEANGEGYLIYIPSKNGTVTPGAWQTWQSTSAGTSNWWMPTQCTGDGTEPNSTRTWAEWVTALAGTPVKAYSLSLGSGEANTDTHVTSFTINGKTFDFEAA